MKILKATFIVALFSIIACKKTERQTEIETTTTPAATEETTEAQDKEFIDKLVKDMYTWNETRNHEHEFETVVKDGYVIGYNIDSHKKFLQELGDSGFFAEDFIANMDKILQEQNKLLSSGKLKWRKGDLGPFSGDVNEWCGCQDEPAPYTKLTTHIEDMDATTAKLYWNWEGFGKDWAAEHYNIRTIKENGKWKIAYMQGWDYAAALGVE